MKLSNRSGQTTVEYILLLSIVIGIFVAVSGFLKKNKMVDKLAKPVVQDYRRAYQFGTPEAKGVDSEEVEKHPRVTTGNNFRIFVNPETVN